MSDHPLDAAIALSPQGEHTSRGRTSAAYANMIGPFGGITAAQALNAVLQHPELLGEPIALTVNFAAALADGEFEVTARPARTNRSTQHWIIEMRQGGATVLTATAVTAVRRETWSPPDPPMPEVARPHDVPLPLSRSGVEWVNRYETRFLEGGLPSTWDGSDLGHSRTRVWMRDSPPRVLDFASLTGIADVFFPRIWLRRSLFVPVGTVSMTVYFHASAAELQAIGEGFLFGQAEGQGFHNGYLDQKAQLWSEAGQLVATSHQIMYFKE
ncbi:acyl-CoA thioesterase II [Caenimonas sp. SL110]|uniref:acyl-CoA thioesterase n=1 Tax=Caenimonas sp. SL110 TaxID=1450524 RepID=UPI00065431FB|nr:thioesterase family protein [Caenimonas sp. SL110]